MSFLINQATDPFLMGDEIMRFTRLFMLGLSAFVIAPALFLRGKSNDEPAKKPARTSKKKQRSAPDVAASGSAACGVLMRRPIIHYPLLTNRDFNNITLRRRFTQCSKLS